MNPVKLALSIPFGLLALLAWTYVSAVLYCFLTGIDPETARPWTLFEQWHHYGSMPRVGNIILASLGVGLLALVLPAVPPAVAALRKKPSQYGDARFAEHHEIRKAGMLKPTGAILGRLSRSQFLYEPDPPGHIMLAAPTGSGKGQGFVLPNLFHVADSAVILDPKREAWHITAGYRRRHQPVYYFNPATHDQLGHRWNPFFYVDENPDLRVDACQKIAHLLCPNPPDGKIFWEAGARELFLACALYLFELHGDDALKGSTHKVTLGAIRRLIHHPDGIDAFFSFECHRLAGILSVRTSEMMQAIVTSGKKADKTLDGFIRTLSTSLELFANPLTDAATSGNDFDLRDLRKQRMTIYVIVDPDNRVRMAPIISLFFQQVIDLNTRELPLYNKDLKYVVNLVLDEATSVGRIPALSDGISYVRGYGLRIWTIVQSISQLNHVNGANLSRNYIDNHTVRIVFAPNQYVDAKEVSDALGFTTIKAESKSIGKDGKSSKSISNQPRALMLPQEIRDLGRDDQLVLVAGMPPIRCRKVVVRSDAAFLGRFNGAPSLPKFPIPPFDPLPRVPAAEPALVAEPKKARPKKGAKPVAQHDMFAQQDINKLADLLVAAHADDAEAE